MNTPAVATRPKRGILLLLLLLFFGPLLLAFVLYYGSDWRPTGRTNHGVLIEPARTLPLGTLAGAEVLTGKWSLVYVNSGDCDAECRNTLYFMRQTQLGLANLDAARAAGIPGDAGCCDRDYLAREQPGLITLDADGAAGAALLAQFPSGQRASSIFMVDPRGNLMMRYDAHDDPKGLRNDLKKLLTLSHIG